jgi:hypothetical protein
MEDGLVLEEIHAHLRAPRCSSDVFDELDCFPGHQEVALVSALDLERVSRWPSVAIARFLQHWKKTALIDFRLSSMAAATRSGSRL